MELGTAVVEELVMPHIKSIGVIEGVRTAESEVPPQYIARVVVEREETIVHGDIFPHFEGKQYRSLGSMSLVDGKDWKSNGRGVEERIVEVGVVPIEPDGTSFIRMRFSSSLVGWPNGEKIIARGRKKKRKR